MKAGFIVGAMVALGLIATTGVSADTSVRTETTTYSGTVQHFQPAESRIVIKTREQPQPQTYSYSQSTKFIDADGNEITEEKVSEQIVQGSQATATSTRRPTSRRG